MAQINLDEVARLIRAAGQPAVVEMTGGNVATLFAGKPYNEDGYGERYPLAMGPGAYGYGQEPSTAWTDDGLCYGHDDNGVTDPVYATDEDTEATLALTSLIWLNGYRP